jgi:hypothetical protein
VICNFGRAEQVDGERLRRLAGSILRVLGDEAAIEKAVYFKMADLMNADVDLIFYDTTSLHFEVDERRQRYVVCHNPWPCSKRGSRLRRR